MWKRIWKLGKGSSCNVRLDFTTHTTLHPSNCALKLVLIYRPHPVYLSDNSAERNPPFSCNCTTTLWIWNGMTVPFMSCRAIKFASLIGKWLKERAYSQVKRALWNVGWCAIGDDICNCVGHHVMHLLPYLLPNSLCFINVRTSFHKYRKSRCFLFLCYQHLNKNVVNR